MGRLLFNVLAMVAEFEGDLIRLRTREGMRVAKAKGRLRGKQPKLNVRQEAHLVALHRSGEHRAAERHPLDGLPGHPAGRRPSTDGATRSLRVGRHHLVGGSANGTRSRIGLRNASMVPPSPLAAPPRGGRDEKGAATDIHITLRFGRCR